MVWVPYLKRVPFNLLSMRKYARFLFAFHKWQGKLWGCNILTKSEEYEHHVAVKSKSTMTMSKATKFRKWHWKLLFFFAIEHEALSVTDSLLCDEDMQRLQKPGCKKPRHHKPTTTSISSLWSLATLWSVATGKCSHTGGKVLLCLAGAITMDNQMRSLEGWPILAHI